jgi:hypothetical protein
MNENRSTLAECYSFWAKLQFSTTHNHMWQVLGHILLPRIKAAIKCLKTLCSNVYFRSKLYKNTKNCIAEYPSQKKKLFTKMWLLFQDNEWPHTTEVLKWALADISRTHPTVEMTMSMISGHLQCSYISYYGWHDKSHWWNLMQHVRKDLPQAFEKWMEHGHKIYCFQRTLFSKQNYAKALETE